MSTVDKTEIEKFSKLASDWWNPNGKFKPLHLFNPARIKFIREKLISRFRLDSGDQIPLKNINILDIGCGGGLLCEPLKRLGATVTGIDSSKNNIEVAQLHAREMDLNIKYINCSPEKLEFKNPKNTLISNVTGSEITSSSLLKDLLIKQIESKVRWRESVMLMIKSGVKQFIEIGPGKVLSSLIKRIDKNVKVSAINNEEDIKLININD